MNKPQVFKFPLRNVLLEHYCAMSGETPAAVRTRISRGEEWAEGVQYTRAPNGRLYIILEGVDQWVESGPMVGQKASNQGIAA